MSTHSYASGLLDIQQKSTRKEPPPRPAKLRINHSQIPDHTEDYCSAYLMDFQEDKLYYIPTTAQKAVIAADRYFKFRAPLQRINADLPLCLMVIERHCHEFNAQRTLFMVACPWTDVLTIYPKDCEAEELREIVDSIRQETEHVIKECIEQPHTHQIADVWTKLRCALDAYGISGIADMKALDHTFSDLRIACWDIVYDHDNRKEEEN